jgi:hypothetical protein
MTSTLRRTAALGVAAVTGFGTVALTTAAASAHTPPKAHTSLSIRAARGAINPGGGDVIRGNLQARGGHNAGRRIVLREHAQGTTAWTNLKRHRTARHGQVSFQVAPTETTVYQLVFFGNRQQQRSHSGVVTVRVLDTTSLVISTGASSIDPGDSDTVNGVLSLDGSPLAGQTVQLLSATKHQRLHATSSAMTDGNGDVSFSVTPPSTSRYQLVFRKTDTNAGARSAQAVIRVRQPSSLSIRARANNGHEVITGDLRGTGHGLAKRRVTLQSRPSGTATWTAVAKHHTKHGGFVSFRVPAPTASTDYQLVFNGGPFYDGCQSGVVTVTVG